METDKKFEEFKKKFPELTFPSYFGTDSGWDTLLEYTLASCQKKLKYAKKIFVKWGLNESLPQIRVQQVKEKFGGLRFYASIELDPESYSGELGIELKEDIEEIQNNFYKMISSMEDLSYCICEHCGSTQNVTTRGKWWIKTLCENCRVKREESLAKDRTS